MSTVISESTKMWHHYVRYLETGSKLYTQAELDEAVMDEREAFIEIANNECSKLQGRRCILNAICKRGEKS